MKAYSIDFREKIVKAYKQGNISVRRVASRFDVSRSFVQKLLEMKKNEGHVEPRILAEESRVSWIKTKSN